MLINSSPFACIDASRSSSWPCCSRAYGVYAWETLSVEAYPELGDVAAQVTTQIPGLAAEEVEQLITVPLERADQRHAGPVADALLEHLRPVA